MTKLIADENVDRPIVQWLREQGSDVSWRAEREPGAADSSIAAVAMLENRILITLDRDFGELVFRQGMRLVGVLYIRFRVRDPATLVTEFSARVASRRAETPRAWRGGCGSWDCDTVSVANVSGI